MNDIHPRRILAVTDHVELPAALIEDLHGRAENRDVQIRLVIINPAHGEVHLLHPERRDKAAAAEKALRGLLPSIEQATGAHVVGSVSVRHDPMDAIEETLHSEPVDEIVLALPAHRFSTLLHQDLASRLAHYGLPVHTVPMGSTKRS
jgi:hypothetical protein